MLQNETYVPRYTCITNDQSLYAHYLYTLACTVLYRLQKYMQPFNRNS